MKLLLLVLISFSSLDMNAQTDSLPGAVTIIEKDPRIDMLGKKMAEYNEALASRPGGIKMVRGYRLMVLSSTDRNEAMGVRSRLLQLFPDQKVYMTFQSPYIKLKFGNFADKKDAEKYRKQIASYGIVKNNVYLVPEQVEIRVEKTGPGED